MSASARVHSLDALTELREKLCAFGVDAQEALCSTELEIRRVFDWLQSRAKHWQHAVRECQEEVVRAKSELTRRKYGQGSGPGPGCTDQEIADFFGVTTLTACCIPGTLLASPVALTPKIGPSRLVPPEAM